MRLRCASIGLALSLAASPASALTMSDTLAAWRDGSAMERMQLASKLGKNFIALNESFTAEYFLKCIDDVSTYGNATKAKIDDATRECVAARMRKPGDDDE